MLFQKQISRKPNLYPWTADFIRAMEQNPWTVDHFNFSSDLHQFKTELNEQEREVIVKALSCIGQIEIAVKTFWAKLYDHLPHPAIGDLGYTMAHVEVVHNNSYERLLEVLGLTDVFEENLKLDIIQGRVNYLRKYLERNYDDDKQQYIYSLILFTLFVENVSLFSQFYVVLWFNKYRKVFKDTAQIVQYTKSEELIHGQVGSKIINTLREEYPKLFDEHLVAKVKRAAKEAYKAEEKIIDWILGSYEGENISAPILKEYVKNRINSSLNDIEFDKAFDVDKELIEKTQWMEVATHANAMTDFFVKRPIEYSRNTQDFSAKTIFKNDIFNS